MGCRALTASLVKLLSQAVPDLRIAILGGVLSDGSRVIRLTQGQVVEVEALSYRLSPRRGLRRNLIFILLLAALWRLLPVRSLRRRIAALSPWLQALEAADWVGAISGGDSFADIYGVSRFLENAAPILVALLLKRRLVLLPQTYGPYHSGTARLLARFILVRAACVYSRDREGMEVVSKLLGASGPKTTIAPSPDVAFCLEAISPVRVEIQPELTSAPGTTVVGINVNGLLWMGGYNRANMFGLKSNYRETLLELVKQFARRADAEVLLVPHTFGADDESDHTACRELFARLVSEGFAKVHLVNGNYDQHEIKAIIQQCGFFIGSRMHACIAALSQGIPCVGIAYSRKFAGVFDTVGMSSLALDARLLSGEQIIPRCLSEFERRGRTADELASRVPEARQQLVTTFRKLAQRLNQRAVANAVVQ